MRKTYSLLGIALALILLVPVSAWAIAKDETPPTEMQNRRELSFTVPMGSWLTYTQERRHENNFKNVMKGLESKDLKQAEHDLDLVDSFLRIEEGRASGEGLPALKEARAQLHELHEKLKSETPIAVPDIEKTFAQVDFTLAKNGYLLAKQELYDQQVEVSGFDLFHFAHDFESALQWGGVGVDANLDAQLEQVRNAANQLKTGGNFDSAKIDAAFTSGQQLLDKYAANFIPKK